MAKPSMFSSSYDQQMKRRRLNIILVILIILFGGFFGAKYYLKKNNIVLFYNKNKPVENKTTPQNQSKNTNNTTNTGNKTTDTQKQNTAVSNPQQLFYQYTRMDGKTYKIQYKTINGEQKQITGFVDDSKLSTYDISKDKQSIVFDDNSNQTIILGDVNGNFKIISRDTYKSKSKDKTYLRDNVISENSWYVWAQKPHFTSGGNVVYASHLPYFKKGGPIYLWVMKPDGTSYRKIGRLAKDIDSISYGSFDSKGRLEINVNGDTYYISPTGHTLMKQ